MSALNQSLVARAVGRIERKMGLRGPLVLHLGLHKTATTAVQSFLGAHVDALRHAGVVYTPLEEMRAHYTPEAWDAPSWRDMPQTATLMREAGRRAVLLSDENLISTSADVWRASLYLHARRQAAKVIMAARPRRAVVVVVLREPAAFLASLYCEYLRHHDFIPFETYYEFMDLEAFSYLELFGWLRDEPDFFEARVMPFEASLGGGVPEIAQTLLHACGVRRHGLDFGAIPRIRDRATFSADEMARIARTAADEGPAAGRALVSALDADATRPAGARYAPIEPGLASRLSARYRQDLRAFGVRLPPDATRTSGAVRP